MMEIFPIYSKETLLSVFYLLVIVPSHIVDFKLVTKLMINYVKLLSF